MSLPENFLYSLTSTDFIQQIIDKCGCKKRDSPLRTMPAHLTKDAIATSIVIIFWQVAVSYSSGAQCQNATYSVQNRVLADYAFITVPFATIKSCVMFCKEKPKCKSINYYQNTETCELNNMSEVSSPENMMDFKTALYMTISPCYYDNECRNQEEICVAVGGSRKCKVCTMEAFGLEDGRIPDSAISASSFVNENAHPSRVRLNSLSAWVADHSDRRPWVQVDLGNDAMIKKIATQGKRGAHHWVRSYTLSSHANGETDWVTYKENDVPKVFQGNNDQKTVVSHVLLQHIRARFVRFWPKTWTFKYKAMRAELYGCFLQ